MLKRWRTLESSLKLATAKGRVQRKQERGVSQMRLGQEQNGPGFLPDSDLLAALRWLSLEAVTLVGPWGGRHQQRQGDLRLILGGGRRQEAHLCTV